MSFNAGSVFFGINVDRASLERELAKSKSTVKGFADDAERILDKIEIGDGLTRGLDGRLRDAQGRFVKAGRMAGQGAGQAFGREFGDTALREADSLGRRLGDKIGTGIKAAGIGALALGGFATKTGLDSQATASKLAAELGMGRGGTTRLEDQINGIYKQAWGADRADVANAFAAVKTSIPGTAGLKGDRSQELTTSLLDMSTTFDFESSRLGQVVGQTMRTGLAKNATEALDLITKSSQEVPKNVRDDLLDALDEYAPFFAQLGISGEQAFGMLVKGAERGMYGIDKTGDAIKELTIRGTDLSKSTRTAYKAIGADTEDMTRALLSGGDAGAAATRQIVNGLLGIKDPGKQAEAALALFGAPLEDLSTQDVPKFLQSMADGQTALKGFEGSTERLSKTLNDNTKTSLTEFKRTLEVGVVDLMEDSVIPALEAVAPVAQTVADAFASMPSWAKGATLAGAGAGILGIKALQFRNLLRGPGGALGGLAGAATKGGAVPVFVVNGMPGGGFPTGAASKSMLSRLGAFARGASGPALAAAMAGTAYNVISQDGASEAAAQVITKKADVARNAIESNLGKYAEDLGIDVNRLARELANGNRAYYLELSEELQASTEGVKNSILGGLGAVPGINTNAERALDALEDLVEVYEQAARYAERNTEQAHAVQQRILANMWKPNPNLGQLGSGPTTSGPGSNGLDSLLLDPMGAGGKSGPKSGGKKASKPGSPNFVGPVAPGSAVRLQVGSQEFTSFVDQTSRVAVSENAARWEADDRANY